MRLLALLVCCLAVIAGSFGELSVHHIVSRAVEEARNYYDDLEDGHIARSNGTATRSHKTTREIIEQEKDYEVVKRAVETLVTEHDMPYHEASRHVRQATNNAGACQFPGGNCVNSRYRTFDGTCNNLNRAWWGAATTAQNRLLSPESPDVDQPRGGLNSFLPNAEDISAICHFDNNLFFPSLSNMVPQFGQFLDHDMSMTPDAGRQCCSSEPNGMNCWRIADNVRKNGRTCIDFTRSTACNLNGQRRQTNQNSVFIDASQIYGSNANRANALRTFSGGKLKTNTNGFGFLPNANQVSTTNTIQGTFVAGDDRINEMPGLMVMHNLFLIEHNRIAEIFRTRTGWNDETIYQETRRIIGAMLQVITYKEYLPAVLDKNIMSTYRLNLFPSDGCTTYEQNTDPTILNEFTTAAYRFGHTLVQSVLALINPINMQQVDSYDIKDQYFQSQKVLQSNGQGYDWILTGLAATACRYFDPFVVPGLTEHLFKAQNANFGSDLIARNIQRGRDHQLRKYNDYRTWAGQSAMNFQSCPSDMDPTAWNNLKKVYRSPDDVDLFVGGISELPLGSSASGRTFQYIKAVQFQNLRYGDRYFVSHCGVFSPNQWAVLSKRRLSDIMCQSSQRPSAPVNAFFKDSPSLSCSDSSRIFDITPFLPGAA